MSEEKKSQRLEKSLKRIVEAGKQGENVTKCINGWIHQERNLSGFAATLAVSLEILLILFRGYFQRIGILKDFLSALSNNFFIACLAAVAIFLILHMVCIILIDFLFPKWISSDLTSLIRVEIDKIEKGVVLLVCNLFEGFVSLFNFIPDFFNTLGCILLGQDQLFPQAGRLFAEDKNTTRSGGKGERSHAK